MDTKLLWITENITRGYKQIQYTYTGRHDGYIHIKIQKENLWKYIKNYVSNTEAAYEAMSLAVKILLFIRYAIDKKDNINQWIDGSICEFNRASNLFGKFKSKEEGYGVILEEIDELWDAIKGNLEKERLMEECIQIIAMCIRFVYDLCDFK